MLKRLMQVSPLVAMIAIGCTWVPSPVVSQAVAASEGDEESMESIDELVLSSGTVVRGKIIEETETEIVFELRMPGFPPIERRYRKAEVAKITRDVDRVERADIVHDPVKADKGKDKDNDNPFVNNDDPDAAQIYRIRLSGRFGYNVTHTPVQELIDDINRVFDDAKESNVEGGPATVVDDEVRDKHIVLLEIDCTPGGGFDGLWNSIEFINLFEQEIHDRGRRVVMLVNQAVDGSAFLPWISKEIYFLEGGIMGISSDLHLFDIGDPMVNEKQISLRLGHAQGYAILGGYVEQGPAIIKAMARSTYWLSVLWTGATPRVSLREPTSADLAAGWELLSDDGLDENDDDMQQGVRNPNDQFVLRDDTAFRLKVSQGTVSNAEEILFLLGVHRNANYVEHEGNQIFADWNKALATFTEKAFPGSQRQRPGELWRDYGRIQVAGDFNDRRKARGRQLQILKQIRSITQRVAEAVDPDGGLINEIEFNIYVIQYQQRLDNENR